MAESPKDWGAVEATESPAAWGAVPVEEKKKKPFAYRDENGVLHLGENFLDLSSESDQGAAIRSGLAEVPGAAAGAASFGAVQSLPFVQSLQQSPNMIGKAAGYGLPIISGMVGGAAASFGTHEVIKAAAPEIAAQLEKDAQDNPNAVAAGAVLAQAPFFKPSLAMTLKQRLVPAGIAGGISLGTEAYNGNLDEDALVRSAIATLGGAGFTNPTAAGEAMMGAGARLTKPITSRLGNVSKEMPIVEATSKANDLALEPVAPPTPGTDAMSLLMQEKAQRNLPQVAGQPPANAGEGLGIQDIDQGSHGVGGFSAQDLAGEAAGAPKATEGTGLGQFEPTVPRDIALDVRQGFQPPELKAPLEFGGEPRSPEAQAKEQKAFNERVQKVTENLGNEGVDIDRQTAVKLARITDPAEFNAARQQLIDSVKKPVPEIPKKGPIKELEKLPDKMGQDEFPAPETQPEKGSQPPPEEPPPAAEPAKKPTPPEVPKATETPPVKESVPASKETPDYTHRDTVVERVTDAVKRKNLELGGRLVKGGSGEDATPENVAAQIKRAEDNIRVRQEALGNLVVLKDQNPNASVPEIRSHLPADSGATTWDEPINTHKRLIADARQYIEDVKAAGELYSLDHPSKTEAKPSKAKAMPQVVEQPLEQPKPKAKKTPATKETDVAERTIVKVGDTKTTIVKKKSDGNWYNEATGEKLSDGSRQYAIEKLKISSKPAKEVVKETPEVEPEEPTPKTKKSRIKSEQGSVLNPFENFGEPTKLGERALEAANEPLLERMAKTDVEATNPTLRSEGRSVYDTFAGTKKEAPAEPSVEFPKPGEGRAQSKAEKKTIEGRSYDTEGLLPTKDSITGEQIPENIKENARRISEKLKADSAENKSWEPDSEVSEPVSKAPEEYVPFLTDLASRIPLMDNPILRPVSKAIGSVAKLVRDQLGVVTGNIRDYSPRIQGALAQKVYDRNQMLIDWYNRADELGKVARKTLSPAEFNALDLANLNGDRESAMAIFKGKPNETALVDAYDAHQKVMAEARDAHVASGRDVGEVDNYFRRKLVDRDGLLKAMGKEGVSAYDDALNQATRSKGASLTPDEKDKILNNFIMGSMRNAGKPGWLKGRTIEKISKEWLKYYEPFDVATHEYLTQSARDISNRKWFGKVEPDSKPFEGNFGRLLKEEMASGRLRTRGFDAVTKSLQAYFNHSAKWDGDLTKWANRARKFQTYAYLADIGNAAVQFADYFNIARQYGFGKASRAYGKKPFNGLEGIGIIEGSNQDILKNTRMPKGPIETLADATAGRAMKVFIGWADRINKGAIGKAAFDWVHGVVNDPSSFAFKRLNETYSKMFPERWPAILKDLKSADFKAGKLNDNTRFFLFNEVSNLQPIDPSGRSQGYNSSGPFAKLLFTLRSYPLKQLDVFRASAYEKMKRPGTFREGALAAITYGAIVGIGQQLVNYARDVALNRADTTSVGEYAINGVLQLAMIPRYAFYKAKEDTIADAALDTLIPGLGVARDIDKDRRLLQRWVFGQRDSTGERTVNDTSDFFAQSRLTQYIPAVGRPTYWWLGRGAEQTKKTERDILEGKPQKSTLELMSELFVEPDLATPRKH